MGKFKLETIRCRGALDNQRTLHATIQFDTDTAEKKVNCHRYWKEAIVSNHTNPGNDIIKYNICGEPLGTNIVDKRGEWTEEDLKKYHKCTHML